MKSGKENSIVRKLIIRCSIMLIVLIAMIAILFAKKNKDLTSETNARLNKMEEGTIVKIAKAGYVTGGKELLLVGEAIPYQNVVLYAKISGYVDKMLVDKGDKVKEGQLLATIISPEIDQSFKAALADLQNKKAILKRDEDLFKKEYISQEEKEQSETNVKISEANVKSLSEQQGYKSIIAPFSGTVTARFADPGSLVQNATNAQTSALPVVTVAELGRLRIYVYIEQKDANYIKTGYPVTITLAENPQFSMDASITRITGQLDEQTRMMTTEIDIDNTTNEITAGSYVQVHIKIPGSNKLLVPSEALVIRNNKYFVPVVNDSSYLHFKPVNISENNGQKLVITSGIQEGDKVALNVGESISEGQKVKIVNSF